MTNDPWNSVTPFRRPDTPSPPRSGEPWTDEDYETLVRLCREGKNVDAIAEALGRSAGPVSHRAKKLLSLDQRGVPQDRALTQLRTNLQSDDDYDWAGHLAAAPPPRPIINNVLPPPLYSGIEGLDNRQLSAAAAAMVSAGNVDDRTGIARVVSDEIRRRGLISELREDCERTTQQRVTDFLGAPWPDAWDDWAGNRWDDAY